MYNPLRSPEPCDDVCAAMERGRRNKRACVCSPSDLPFLTSPNRHSPLFQQARAVPAAPTRPTTTPGALIFTAPPPPLPFNPRARTHGARTRKRTHILACDDPTFLFWNYRPTRPRLRAGALSEDDKWLLTEACWCVTCVCAVRVRPPQPLSALLPFPAPLPPVFFLSWE